MLKDQNPRLFERKFASRLFVKGEKYEALEEALLSLSS